jgi:hypothetical protein
LSLSIDPMSMQNSQPASAAALVAASSLRRFGRRSDFSVAYSRPAYPDRIRGWCANRRSGSVTVPNSRFE